MGSDRLASDCVGQGSSGGEAAAAWEPRRGAGRGRRELGREQRPGVLVWVGIELLAVRGTLVILKYFMSYII